MIPKLRKIVILPDVKIENAMILGEPPIAFSMKQWAKVIIQSHKPFGAWPESSKGVKLLEAFANAETEVLLEQADWENLKECMKNAINPQVSISCNAYYEAVENAKNVEVEPKKD